MLLAVWYPASALSARIRYSDYPDVPHAPELEGFALRLKQFSETTARETIFGRKEESLTQEERLACDHLFRTASNAYREAPHSPGRFPLVIYHSGAAGSFDDNAVLFEFLASYGYVVISSAYQINSVHVSNNVDWSSKSIRDMQFLLQAASKLPFVDIRKIAGLGHSAGAQNLLRWIGEPDCPLSAMISLDTTLEYTPRNFPGHKELRQELESMEKPVIPVMLFASAERRPNFGTFDRYLQRAPRYEVAVPHLRHNDYLSQRAMSEALTSITPGNAAQAGSIRRSYDQVCITIRRFLDLVFNSDEQARTALQQSTKQAGSPATLRVHYRAPQ